MSSFTQVFGGTMISPSELSYLALDLDADVTMVWPLDAASGADIIARIVDITPSGAFTIEMPDATLTSTGNTIFFNNLGPDDVDIVDAAGGALLSLAQGEVWQIYLTDNSTAAGTWRVFQYGASTAQAQASALAGPGIIAIGSVLAQAVPTSTIASSPYTFVTTERAQAFIWTGALGTFNLPAAATAGNNWFINVRNGGTGNLTIDPSGAETINGTSTLSMSPGDSAVLVTDGIEWWTIGLGQRAIFAFDYTSIDVTGLSGTYTLSGAELNRIAYQFTGALAGNLEVVVPPTIQQYWATNDATGFTLSLNTASGTPVNIASGDKSIYYCNGTDVVLAVTTSGIATPISITDGGTGGTSAANARSNLGAAASGANADITSLTALGAGTVSAPSLAPTGDSNTGFWYPAADIVGASAGGIRVLALASGGANGCVALGYNALRDATLTSGTQIGIGSQAGLVSTNSGNIYIGASAGFACTGSNNTYIGLSAAQSATSGSNNICLGNSSALAATTSSNSVTLGNGSISVLRCQVTTITSLSDERDKTDIRPIAAGMDLELVNVLRPVCFTWNMRDGGKVGIPDVGFIAQELLQAQEACGVVVPGLVYSENPDRLEAGPGTLIPVLVRAVQQLSDMLDCEQAERQALAARVAELEARG